MDAIFKLTPLELKLWCDAIAVELTTMSQLGVPEGALAECRRLVACSSVAAFTQL
jgi:hypothetical protein